MMSTALSPISHHSADCHTEPASKCDTDRWLTIPNVLCAVRLIGAGVLVWLALAEQPRAFLILFLVLAMTDWIDGKLAILLRQRSVIGPRLDSIADAALYTALGLGSLWLKWDELRFELPWGLTAVATYFASIAFGIWKYRKMLSYHTRAAKTCWLLIMIGGVSLLAEWSLWPLRVAFIAVILTNLEAILITCVLTEWRADVTSVYHAWKSKSSSTS